MRVVDVACLFLSLNRIEQRLCTVRIEPVEPVAQDDVDDTDSDKDHDESDCDRKYYICDAFFSDVFYRCYHRVSIVVVQRMPLLDRSGCL